MALGKGNELVARSDTASWRAAIMPLRQAAAHFEAANDLQALAEAEYQRGYVEFNLLYEFEDGRRIGRSRASAFRAPPATRRAPRAPTVLRALNEFNIAVEHGPGSSARRAARAARHRGRAREAAHSAISKRTNCTPTR